MIRIKFYNLECIPLDIEEELKIDVDVEDFITANIPSLEFEAHDFAHDLNDSLICWFSSKQELIDVKKIEELFYFEMHRNAVMKIDIKITDNFDWS